MILALALLACLWWALGPWLALGAWILAGIIAATAMHRGPLGLPPIADSCVTVLLGFWSLGHALRGL